MWEDTGRGDSDRLSGESLKEELRDRADVGCWGWYDTDSDFSRAVGCGAAVGCVVGVNATLASTRRHTAIEL